MQATYPVAQVLNLSELPPYAPIILASSLFFAFLQSSVSPQVLGIVAGHRYTRCGSKQREQWNIRFVAFVHAFIILYLALQALYSPELDEDKLFGWSEASGTMSGVACGYFLWDIMVSITHYNGLGFLLHALVCFAIYMFTFKPFLAYYACRFLLWELSTPFLHIHWFMDKMAMSGSSFQLINGVFLLITFVTTRLLYGTWMSYRFFLTLFDESSEMPVGLLLVYGLGNIILNGLNFFWFTKIVAALRRRF